MKKILKIVIVLSSIIFFVGFFQLPEENQTSQHPKTPAGNSSQNIGGGTGSNADIKFNHDVKKVKGGRSGYVKICLVLDGSGSMRPYREEMVDACKKFLDLQKALPGTVALDVWTFPALKDGRKEKKLVAKKIIKDARLDKNFKNDFSAYICSGGTPCYDAMIVAIKDLQKHIKVSGILPETVIFVFFTDGLDNQSNSTINDVAKQIAKQIDNWNFLFLGAGQRAAEEGVKMGLPPENCFNVTMRSSEEIRLIWEAVDKFSRRSRGIK